jgi:hypothetical protein
MSNHRKQRTGEGYDKPRSPEWYAAVRVEALVALAKAKARDAAARAARDAVKAARQRSHDHER